MSNITNRLNRVLDIVNSRNIAQEGYRYFKDITPERTGYAKAHTTLTGNEINADYPYAQVLDKGRHMTRRGMRGSELAPEGMSKPTLDHIRTYIFLKLGIKV